MDMAAIPARTYPSNRALGALGAGQMTPLGRLTLTPLLLLALYGGASSVGAESAPWWPQFHGPNGANVSADTGLLKQWPEAGPKLLWTAEGLGHGYGSVSLAGGRIYVAGDIGTDYVVTALNLDGAPQWRFENGAAWEASVPGGRGTPTTDGERVYSENAHGDVVCVDDASGVRIWGRNLVQDFAGRYSSWGYAESLVVDGEHVICCPGGDTAMAALDRTTGQTVWKSPSSGEPAGYSTPVLGEHQGLRMIFTMSERSLIGVNADTGDLLFRFEHVNPQYVANCVSPIYHDGHVFISGGYRTGSVLLKINVDGKKAAVEPVWRAAELDNRHGGVILLDGFLYGASQVNSKGKWVCLEWETGRARYAEPGVGEGSATVADGMLYTLSERRQVGLIKATPEGHAVVSQFTLPDSGSGATWAHPVVCGGRLYIRHGDRVYAYDVRSD